MEFRLLGPLGTYDAEGRALDPGRPMQRAVLAMLLLQLGRVVSVAALIDGLWGDDPPPSAVNSVQGYVSRLRKVLGAEAPIAKVGAGYRLEVLPEAVDVTRFETLAAEGRNALARGEATAAAGALGRALALHHGPPLAEFLDQPFAMSDALRLERMVRAVEEDLVDARLALGQHQELLGDIERLVGEDPHSERRWGQLMTALFLAGRQADALAAFQRARGVLVDELGIEPGSELRQVEAEILAQSLRAPTPLPAGAVTFFLTDIEGSVRLWELDASAMAEVIARHDAIADELVDRHGGQLRKTRGEGDSTFSVFSSASDAIAAALDFQIAVASEPWSGSLPVRVRAVVHTGEAEFRDGDYYGPAVNRAARARGLAHGGQVLVTEATCALVSDALPPAVGLRDLGQHRLRDLSRPERLFQLTHPMLVDDFSALPNSVSGERLPSRSSSFVGRDQERGDVAAAIGESRLVTLTGPGGCGKTSLAVTVAREAADEFPDGVYFVDLAPIGTADLVPNTVADALGVRARPGERLTDSVADYLAHQRALVVLDNCEHVAEGARALVDAALCAGASVRILATSRQHLGLAGEVIWVVPPLTPDVAVQLFEERATAASPAFNAATNRSSVERLCDRVDGMPLAIELAAARVSVLSVEQIVDRLDDALRLLGDVDRTAPPRQRTLRATFQWSYDLLSPAEQRLFARLAVFAGGFTLEAVEAIADGMTVADEDVVGFFVRLVEKSLVLRAPGADSTQPRYRLLEPLRQFARAHLLAEGGEQVARDLHSAFFLRFVEEVEPNLYKAGSRLWLDRIGSEHANLRAALGWTLDEGGGDQAVGVRIVGALAWAWFAAGNLAEGRQWAEAALGATSGERSAQRGRALIAAVLAESGLGELDAMVMHSEALLALGEELDDHYFVAYGCDGLGIAAWARGNFQEAIDFHRRAVACYDEFGDGFDAALACAELGRDLAGAGDAIEAAEVFEMSVNRARSLGEDAALGFTLDASAKFALELGDSSRAAVLIGEAVDHYRASGYLEGLASGLSTRASAALASGAPERAAPDLTEAVALCRRLGHVPGAASALDGFAQVHEQRGSAKRAIYCTAAAAALRARAGVATTGIEQREIESRCERLRSVVGSDSYDVAWGAGSAIGIDQVEELVTERQTTQPAA